MIKVEYLLPFDTKNGICKDIESFNSLVSSHCDISIKNDEFKYKSIPYKYTVHTNEVSNKNYSVFHVIFENEIIDDDFCQMLNSFKKTVGVSLKNDLQVIWDGIGFELSKKLYPLIYKIENLMRKLISKFMLINLGCGWQKDTTPSKVKESIKGDSSSPNHNILYEVDFIQLSNFLFTPYPNKKTEELSSFLSKIKDKDTLPKSSIKELLEFRSINNWDRYFKNILNCESEQLKSKWEDLYKIRCKIAHNNSITNEDFKSASLICNYLEEILTKAFDKLNEIKILEKDKENISINTIGTYLNLTKELFNYYKDMPNSIEIRIKPDRINPTKASREHINSIDEFLLKLSQDGLDDKFKVANNLTKLIESKQKE